MSDRADHSYKRNICAVRKAVDKYRAQHYNLHMQQWDASVPAKHTPIFYVLVASVARFGFNSIQEFFDASADFNAQELGFDSFLDYATNATALDKENFDRMWL